MKKQLKRTFLKGRLEIEVIVDCRTTAAHKFKTRLIFKQYDIILTKEQLVLTKKMTSLDGENMQAKHSILGYRIDLYFHN